MKSFGIFSFVSCLVGIIIVAVGFYLKLTEQIWTGYSTLRYGGITGGTINGNEFYTDWLFIFVIVNSDVFGLFEA